jgi:hypothetical protein
MSSAASCSPQRNIEHESSVLREMSSAMRSHGLLRKVYPQRTPQWQGTVQRLNRGRGSAYILPWYRRLCWTRIWALAQLVIKYEGRVNDFAPDISPSWLPVGFSIHAARESKPWSRETPILQCWSGKRSGTARRLLCSRKRHWLQAARVRGPLKVCSTST